MESVAGYGGAVPTHTVEMESYFKAGGEIPEMVRTEHFVTDNNYVYGKPFVSNQPTHTGRDYSHVKYVLFNPAGDSGARGAHADGSLVNIMQVPFQQLNLQSEGYGAPASDLTGRGTKPDPMGFMKSYRILAFEFVDYMDDDVALMNTGTGAGNYADSDTAAPSTDLDEARREIIGTHLNPFGDKATHYEVEIDVKDNTMAFLDLLYTRFISPMIAAWEEYFAYAEELCSYNKSEEEFNQFFVDAMLEKYQGRDFDTYSVDTSAAMAAIFGMIIGDETNTIDTADTSVINFEALARNLPPWVSGAFLSAVIKELFFNNTPRSQLLKTRRALSNSFVDFDASLGQPPDPAVIAFTREMYSISPQKGNIMSLRNFDERIRPLINIFRFEQEQIRNKLLELFGGDSWGDDATGTAIAMHVNENPRTIMFNSSIKIDTPVAVGEDRDSFYFNSYSSRPGAGDVPEIASTVVRQSIAGPPGLMYIPRGGVPATADRHLLKAVHHRVEAYMIANIPDGPWRGPMATVSDYVFTLPDLEDWQKRVLSPGTLESLPHPPGIKVDGDLTSRRLYLPAEHCNEKVLASNEEHLSYFEVIEWDDTESAPLPRIMRLVWYEDPGSLSDTKTTEDIARDVAGALDGY